MLYVLVGTVSLYVVARVVWAHLPRMARHRLRFAAGRLGLLVAAVGATGCDDSYIADGTGGAGGGVTTTSSTSDASPDAPAACASVSDCPADLAPAGACLVMNCDPSGTMTQPGSNVPGCYVTPAPAGTTCPLEAGAGVCTSSNGTVATVCKLPP